MLKRRVVALSLIISLLSLARRCSRMAERRLLSHIRKERWSVREIMKTMHMFTDLYGARRLTGSPNSQSAAEWAVKQMTAWGLENAHLRTRGTQTSGWFE
jgi:hypothetical protein